MSVAAKKIIMEIASYIASGRRLYAVRYAFALKFLTKSELEMIKKVFAMTILGQGLEERNGAGSEQIKFLLTCPQKPSIITNK